MAYRRDYYFRNKERIQAQRKANKRPYDGTEARYVRHLKQFYKITKEEYEALLAKQCYVCVVCGKPNQHNKRLHIDHDHKTGKVRGLLCNHCNTALGLVHDDVGVLAALIQYLNANPSH